MGIKVTLNAVSAAVGTKDELLLIWANFCKGQTNFHLIASSSEDASEKGKNIQ